MKMTNEGFTLVELLGVIVVVATLIVLGSVGWQSSLQRARTTQCLGNLKTIGQASMLYAADHDMTLPVTSHQRQSGEKSWTITLQEYASGTVTFKCPCDEDHRRVFTYVLNDFLTPKPAGAANLDFSRLNRLDSASRTILFAEASKEYTNADHFHFAEYAGRGIPPDFFKSQVAVERHLGGANYLFADGHVETLSWKDAQERLDTPGSQFVDPTGRTTLNSSN